MDAQTIHFDEDARYFFDNFIINSTMGRVGLLRNLFYFYRTSQKYKKSTPAFFNTENGHFNRIELHTTNRKSIGLIFKYRVWY